VFRFFRSINHNINLFKNDLKEIIIDNARFEDDKQREEFRKSFEVIKRFKEWYETTLLDSLRTVNDDFKKLQIISMTNLKSAFNNYVSKEFILKKFPNLIYLFKESVFF